jgi:hypothetical protein
VTNGEVYLAGHSFDARVDASGQFRLHWIPPGTYTLHAPLARPLPLEQPVLVASGALTDVGDVKVQSVLTDPMHCGACGVGCTAVGEVCESGACVCAPYAPVRCDPTPWRPYPLCLPEGSSCPACPFGQTSCNAQCVDLMNDPFNCGSCGHSCGGAMCMAGSCMAPPAPIIP